MEDKNSVYIPYGIKNRREYINGFGAKEVTLIVMAIAAGGVLAIVLNLFGINGLICGLTFLFTPTITAVFVGKDECNTSFLGYLAFLVNFNKSQKVYKYKSLQAMIRKER